MVQGKSWSLRPYIKNSLRKNKPFVPLNVAALPSSTLESELFGHEPGSFTGATMRRIGKFEHANGGTLFLDEVGEMPLETQVKLLRVLEARKITRLGANEEIDVNVRLVAATNANLLEKVEKKEFREDLYYRLNVVRIYLPPLRQRRGDITLLLDHFRRIFSNEFQKETQGFSKPALKALMMYDWPGNIRQLRNTVERMLVLDTDGLLDADDLPEEIAELLTDEDLRHPGKSTSVSSGVDDLMGRPLREVEEYYIRRTLELTDGNREEAASIWGSEKEPYTEKSNSTTKNRSRIVRSLRFPFPL